jgi:hypothetical protein
MELNGNGRSEPPARLLTTLDVRAEGIDAPLDSVDALNGAGASVVWLVDRRRVAGALALDAGPAAVTTNGAPLRTDLRRMKQNQVIVAGAQALTLPIAGGALAQFGVLIHPVGGALLAGALTALVAWNARK